MSEIVINQFNGIRRWAIKATEDLSEELANIQPEGFNNTIKWHLGHIITESEYFMFELPGQPVQIPEHYNGLFGPGTKPSEWIGEEPPLNELFSTLKSQLDRVNDISPGTLNQPLEKNDHGFTTAADGAAFSVIHESVHVGQIQAMKRILMVTAK